MKERYDLTVIGAGPGGYTAAIRAARKGLSVALVEAKDVGGACLNRGCIPTKTLLHTAELLHELEQAEELGLEIGQAVYNIDKIYARKDAVVRELREGVEQLVAANGIDLFRGFGKIISAGEVEVTGVGQEALCINTVNIIIATGARPVLPPIPGINLPGVVTSDELLEGLPEGCRRITIIGGGVIGVEFASVFAGLGIAVTIIEAADRLLPALDREIGQNLSALFKKRGITVYTGARVENIEQTQEGLVCACKMKGDQQSVAGNLLLIAVGRRAYAENLFADDFNDITIDRESIVVDEHFETSVKGIYAIGDVIKGGIQLAHVASAQGLCAVSRICNEDPPVDMGVIPSCIYGSPEIAAVGMTADEAKAAGIKTVTGKYPMRGNGRSFIAMQERGFIKLVAEAGSERIIGAQLFCLRATDMVSEFASAIANKLTVHDMVRVIRPHPTFCEGITESLESVHGLATHMAPPRGR